MAPTPTATARPMITSYSSARRSGERSLESARRLMRRSGSMTTAAATTGPASGPRPASSTPATRTTPARQARASYRYGADGGVTTAAGSRLRLGDGGRDLGDALFPQAGGLAGELAQVVELRAADATVSHDVDPLDAWGVQGEGPLDAHAVGDA